MFENRSLESELFSSWKRFDADDYEGGFCGQDGPGGRISPARACRKAMLLGCFFS